MGGEEGDPRKEKSAEKVDRTPDLMIFSHTLSQLSYLGYCSQPSPTPYKTSSHNTRNSTKTMRNCRTYQIDGVIDILRNKDCEFDPEPTTIPYVAPYPSLNDRNSERTAPSGRYGPRS